MVTLSVVLENEICHAKKLCQNATKYHFLNILSIKKLNENLLCKIKEVKKSQWNCIDQLCIKLQVKWMQAMR